MADRSTTSPWLDREPVRRRRQEESRLGLCIGSSSAQGPHPLVVVFSFVPFEPARRSETSRDPHRRNILMNDGLRPGIARRIDHVGVVVRDISASTGWWTDRLGMRLAHTADVLEGSVRLAYLDLGDTTVQLVQPLEPGPLTDWLDANGEGLHHICFLVEGDLDHALDTLDDRGRRHVYLGGRGAEVCFLGKTACGVLIELTGPTSSSFVPSPDFATVVAQPRRVVNRVGESAPAAEARTSPDR